MSIENINSRVQTLLARCIIEPDYLDSLISKMRVARGAGDHQKTKGDDDGLLEGLDLERLLKFSGFVTKVQNNFLWDFIPYTRALLRHYDLEIEVFTRFRAHHQLARSKRTISREERVQLFLTFFKAEIAGQYANAVLDDMFRHEASLFELRNSISGDASDQCGTITSRAKELLASSVPSLFGKFRVVYLNYDPLAIANALENGNFRHDHLSSQLLIYGYWLPPGQGSIHVMSLTHEAAIVLANINGKSSVGEIVRASQNQFGFNCDNSEIVKFLKESAKAGLVSFVV